MHVHVGMESPPGLFPSLPSLIVVNLGSVSRDRARTKAMEFLHEMGYNYVKAKFYILFPYYLKYNSFHCHQPLALSDDEMARRIAEHLESLKSTKEKELERWIGTV